MKSKPWKKTSPWQSALLATSGLAAIFVVTSSLWQAGYPQWGFLLVFGAIWALISISWSNVEYTEASGSLLADIVDHNFAHMHDRIQQLEQELEQLRSMAGELMGKHGSAAPEKRLP